VYPSVHLLIGTKWGPNAANPIASSLPVAESFWMGGVLGRNKSHGSIGQIGGGHVGVVDDGT
jgi:hypothetical protein